MGDRSDNGHARVDIGVPRADSAVPTHAGIQRRRAAGICTRRSERLAYVADSRHKQMRTVTSAAWPRASVEPKSISTDAALPVGPFQTAPSVDSTAQLKASKVVEGEALVTRDVPQQVWVVHVTREHMWVCGLFVLVVLLWARLSSVSARLALLEHSFTSRMK